MSGRDRPGVISSFLLCVAVLLFATGASATEVPFENLPYGIRLDSQREARGAVSAATSSVGSESGNLIIQKTGHAGGVGAILALFRPAARHSQSNLGVPVPSGPVGRQSFGAGSSSSGLPLFNNSNSRSSANPMGVTARGSNRSNNGSSPLGSPIPLGLTSPGEDMPDVRLWGDAGETPGGGNVVIPDIVTVDSPPVPEPSAALVFGLGALLVKSATRRRQR